MRIDENADNLELQLFFTRYFILPLLTSQQYMSTDLLGHTSCLVSDFAIFFELKHYKPKKQIVSTKCWSFLERDEIKEGPAAIEL